MVVGANISIPDREVEGLCRRYHVRSLALFGSALRADFRADSDVDLLVEFQRPVGLFEFVDVKQYLESVLGCRVDLGTPDSLKPRLRESVIAEAIYVA